MRLVEPWVDVSPQVEERLVKAIRGASRGLAWPQRLKDLLLGGRVVRPGAKKATRDAVRRRLCETNSVRWPISMAMCPRSCSTRVGFACRRAAGRGHAAPAPSHGSLEMRSATATSSSVPNLASSCAAAWAAEDVLARSVLRRAGSHRSGQRAIDSSRHRRDGVKERQSARLRPPGPEWIACGGEQSRAGSGGNSSRSLDGNGRNQTEPLFPVTRPLARWPATPRLRRGQVHRRPCQLASATMAAIEAWRAWVSSSIEPSPAPSSAEFGLAACSPTTRHTSTRAYWMQALAPGSLDAIDRRPGGPPSSSQAPSTSPEAPSIQAPSACASDGESSRAVACSRWRSAWSRLPSSQRAWPPRHVSTRRQAFPA